MNMLKNIVFILILIPVFVFAQKSISTDSVKSYVGKDVTVKGVVTQVTISKGGNVFFNMDGKYPNNKFTAVIFKKDLERFGDVKSWEGKTVEVTGKIEDYKGQLEIIIKEPGQIKKTE